MFYTFEPVNRHSRFFFSSKIDIQSRDFFFIFFISISLTNMLDKTGQRDLRRLAALMLVAVSLPDDFKREKFSLTREA